MSGEVIQFPKDRVAAMRGNPQEVPGIDRKHQEERVAKEQDVVRQIREAARDPRRKFERDDQIWCAQAVDGLIVEAKKQKITQREILAELSNRPGKFRHLERLRVDHELSPAADKKKYKKGRSNKVQPYVEILMILAKVLQRSEEEVLLKAFRNTAFWNRATPSPNDPDTEMNYRIARMTEWVINEEKMVAYFETCRKTGAWYDPVVGEFLAHEDPPVLSARGYEGYALVSWEEPPPLPAVPLVRVQRGRFSGLLLVEKRRTEPAGCSFEKVARRVSPLRDWPEDQEPQSFGPADPEPAEVALFTDIRLAIGPRRRADDIGPLFELRSHVELEMGGCKRPLTFDLSVSPLGLEHLAGSVAALLDDGWHRVSGFGRKAAVEAKKSASDKGVSLWPEVARLAPDFGVDSGLRFSDSLIGTDSRHEALMYWEPADALTVAQFLQLLRREFPNPGDQGRGSQSAQRLFPSPPFDDPHRMPTEYWSTSWVCQDLEAALYTGEIEKALKSDCRRLKSKLEKRVEEARQIRVREREKLLARWRNTDPSA